MRKSILIGTAFLVSLLLVGCGSQGEKDVNKNKDKPVIEGEKQD